MYKPNSKPNYRRPVQFVDSDRPKFVSFGRFHFPRLTRSLYKPLFKRFDVNFFSSKKDRDGKITERSQIGTINLNLDMNDERKLLGIAFCRLDPSLRSKVTGYSIVEL